MKTQDDILQEQHEKFLEEVTESGMPLWAAVEYYNAYPISTVFKPLPDPKDYEGTEDTKDPLPFKKNIFSR
jgi:hypothetical protein